MTSKSNDLLSLPRTVLLGAVFALFVVSFFVFGVDRPHPEWGKLWMIRPLIISPMGGALGGVFCYFLICKSSRRMNKFVSIPMGLFLYSMSLWVSIVLGLDGTMWD